MSKFYWNYEQASKLKIKSAREWYAEEAFLNTDAQENQNDFEQTKK
ncbi:MULTISPECIES: hypothetical protein [Vibrio]|nr:MULTISPECIES: hypothetical protein [Vibrio]